ncbi:MAG: proton extrusion protein PcxA [Oscillatoria sp. SIO1A7]|nr:proton extrusion protein PcxA [Oscillatoria sp. SIO1A7]
MKRYFRAVEQWLFNTPERSLDLAYEAALSIKAIEDQHFKGGKISSGKYGESVFAHFEADLQRNLDVIKLRLGIFRNSRSFVDIYAQFTGKKKTKYLADYPRNGKAIGARDPENLILEKLQFIDKVVAKYGDRAIASSSRGAASSSPYNSATLVAVTPQSTSLESDGLQSASLDKNNQSPPVEEGVEKSQSLAGRTSFLPRSILRTLDRFKRELDPKAEDEVVQTFRKSKTKTVISFKFILLIILIPLLTQQLSKNWLIGPIYDNIIGSQKILFLNIDMEEEAYEELHRFEERLKFEAFLATEIEQAYEEELDEEIKEQEEDLLLSTHKLSEEEIEEEVKHKAVEMAEEYRDRSANAIKNVFADICSVIALIIFFMNSNREIAIFKSFIDEIVYGLSDSAKAFIIILFTDVFVGFHSPHGWEVILEGISRHLGIPESRQFIFLFIATFPVILDTVFKYWIFRYLNRISPSAVATYKNMNE